MVSNNNEKNIDNIKKKIIISMCAIILLVLTLFGITYAYFTAKVQGNKNETSVEASAAILKLEYDGEDSYIEVEALLPGKSVESKIFSVKNTGTATVENYDVILENVVNELSVSEDLRYELICTSSDEKGCNSTSGIFPKMNQVIGTNSIDSGVTHTYTLTLIYNDSYSDQSTDMDKEISAKVNIKDDSSNIKTFKIYGNSEKLVQTTGEVKFTAINNLGNKDEVNNSYNIPIHVVNGKNLANPKMAELFVKNMKNEINKLKGMYIKGIYSNVAIEYDNNRPLLKYDSALGYTISQPEKPIPNYRKLAKIFTGIFKENTQYTISFDYYITEPLIQNGVNKGQGMNLLISYTDGGFQNNQNIAKYCGDNKVANQNYSCSILTYGTVNSFAVTYNSGETHIYLDTFQIEEGTTKTDYEPYKGSVVNLTLDEPLRKLDDATDYVDLENRIIVRNVGEIIFDGTENILVDENGRIYYELPHNINIPVISNYDINDTNYEYYVTSTLDSNTIYFNTDMSIDEFKVFLTEKYNEGKPLTVQYGLDRTEIKKIETPDVLLEKSNNIYVCDDSLLCASKFEVEFD